jgi:hypothetical protein
MKRMTRWQPLCALILAAGCSDEPRQDAKPPAVAAPQGIMPYVHPDQRASKVSMDAATLPAKYHTPLPATERALDEMLRRAGSAPPRQHVIGELLDGDVHWLKQLQETGSRVPPADRKAWVAHWHRALYLDAAAQGFCDNARGLMTAPPSLAREALVPTFARQCASSADRPLMLREDTPNAAVLAFFDPWPFPWPMDAERLPEGREFDARLVTAAREVILKPSSQDDESDDSMLGPRGVAMLLARHPDPRALEALFKIHGEIKDREVADQVAIAFLGTQHERGKTLARAACERRKMDPACVPNPFLEQLRASSSPDTEPEKLPQEEVDAIRARIAQLQRLGFTRASEVDVNEAGVDDAAVLLMHSGYAMVIDVETGFFPNQHDMLMRQLAQLVSPALDSAAFEEVYPPDDDAQRPYELIVYDGGKRFRREADNLGDWYDLDAVIDMLNALMRARQASERFFVLETGDQTAIVLAAAPGPVEKAVEAGIIALGSAEIARDRGQEFERETLGGMTED